MNTHRPLVQWTLYSLTVLLMAAQCQPSSTGPAPDHFIIGYVTGAGSTPGSGSIVLRWAPTGATLDWRDGRFPVSVDPGTGVGVMTDNVPAMHIAMTNYSANQIQLVWGLGTEIWDGNALSPTTWTPESSPVGIPIDHPKYAIAYRRAGGSVTVAIYDHDTRSMIADVGPPHALNTSVEGRPDMVRMGNTVVLAWRRWNGSTFDLVTARGTISGENLSFATPQVVATPSSTGSSGLRVGIQSDPALARTETRFLLGAVREETGTGSGGLHGWRTHFFESTDGQSWSTNAISAALDVTNSSLIGLAGVRGEKVIAVAFDRSSSGTVDVSGAVLSGSASWQGMPASEESDMIAGTPNFRHFALIGVIK